jgi:hypothetical protein
MEIPVTSRSSAIAPRSAFRGSAVRLILRSEGGAAFVLALAAYQALGFSWWLFAATILLPDLGLIGYVRGPRAGALVYNLVHTYDAPFALALAGWLATAPLLLALAAIWAAHIGFDRLVGYGLKSPDDARLTHLSPGA